MRARSLLVVSIGILVLATWLPMLRSAPALASGSEMVISQVYGGGGNSGAPYSSKFVELFNRGAVPASLAGWSIQYASATGIGNFSASTVALPAVSIPAGGYFLVQLASGANGVPLPAPDATGVTNPAAASGKVVLASTSVGLACNGGSSPCTSEQLAAIVDLIGYGSANFYEGSGPAPALSNTTAAIRAEGGCADTDDNAADFSRAPPEPRNSSSPTHPCSVPTPEPTAEPTPDATPFAFDFAGFAAPVANLPAANVVKAGSAVPLGFSLGGDFGLQIIAGGAPTSRAHACESIDELEPLEDITAPGSAGLTYDAAADRYTFVWKTHKAWAGTCRTLVVVLTDGSRHWAEFAFR